MPKIAGNHFEDPEAARACIEAARWPDGPACPNCGVTGEATFLKRRDGTGPGLRQCKACRRQFTTTVGTIFEGSRAPLNKWLQALQHVCCIDPAITAAELSKAIGVTYKTAWAMRKRILITACAPKQSIRSFEAALAAAISAKHPKYRPVDRVRQAQMLDRFNAQSAE